MTNIPFKDFRHGAILQPVDLSEITKTIGFQLPLLIGMLGVGILEGFTLEPGTATLSPGKAIAAEGCFLVSDTPVTITGITPEALNYVYIKPCSEKLGTIPKCWTEGKFDCFATDSPSASAGSILIGKAVFGGDGLVAGEINYTNRSDK